MPRKPNGDIVVYACQNGKYFGQNIVNELNKIKLTHDPKFQINGFQTNDSIYSSDYSLDENLNLYSSEIKSFPATMSKVFLERGVRGDDVYIVQWQPKNFAENGPNADNNAMEFLKLVGAALQSGAKRVTLVTPYLFDQRDDQREGRSTIGAQLFPALLSGITKNKTLNGLCYDPHNPTEVGFYEDANIHMEAVPPFKIVTEYLQENYKEFLKNAIILLPDVGSTKRDEKFSEWLKIPSVTLGAIRKSGTEKDVTSLTLGTTSVDGKNILLLDDILGTFTTAKNGIEELKKIADVGPVYGVFSHAELTNIKKLDEAYNQGLVNKIFVPNTTPVFDRPYFEEYDLAKVFAEIIWNLNHDEHIGSYLEKNPSKK